MTSRHPWAVVSIVAAVLAAWIGLGTLHDFDHADSLLPVLVSTQRWTPFFWGQDRFGMLVPLLAMPIRHPLANLLVQGWMMTAAGLLAPFAAARFLTGRDDPWIAIGAGANLLFLLLTPPVVQFDWLAAQPYGLSMCLGFAALLIGERSTRAGATDRGRRPARARLLGQHRHRDHAGDRDRLSGVRTRALAGARGGGGGIRVHVGAICRGRAHRHGGDSAGTVDRRLDPAVAELAGVIARPAWAAVVVLAAAVAIGRLWERGGRAGVAAGGGRPGDGHRHVAGDGHVAVDRR